MTDETLMVGSGQAFKVALEASPGTGYVWDLQALPEGVTLVGSSQEAPASGLVPGGSILQVFHFKALVRGEHALGFVRKRAWESEAVESRTVTVKVD
ncbi:MAG: protease inhibitor I42 family protein [Polaromonas sp.]